MRISGERAILFLTGAAAFGAPYGWTTSRRTRGQGLRQRLNRRDRVPAQGQDNSLLIMSLERLYVGGGLRMRERAKVEGFPRNVEFRNHLIDEL